MLVRFMETQIWWSPPTAYWELGGLNKGVMASATISSLEKAAPVALALKPENSVSLHMSLAPFKLLPSAGAQNE